MRQFFIRYFPKTFTINTQSSRVNGLPRFNCSTSIGPRLSRQQFFSISSTAYNYNKQYQTISCNDPSHLGWCVQHIYKFHGKSDHWSAPYETWYASWRNVFCDWAHIVHPTRAVRSGNCSKLTTWNCAGFIGRTSNACTCALKCDVRYRCITTYHHSLSRKLTKATTEPKTATSNSSMVNNRNTPFL